MRWTEEQLEAYLSREQGKPKPSSMGKVARAKRGTDEISMGKEPPFQPTEDEEQMALFTWAHHMAVTGTHPELFRLFHVPNGGSRGPGEAGRFKAMGVKAGVPDVFLDVPRGGFHGLRIEMKRREGGRLEPEQREWIDHYNQIGYRAVVCYGWDQAREVIEEYLSGPKGLSPQA